MKTDAAPVKLIAVGGGAFLVPERMEGVSEVVEVVEVEDLPIACLPGNSLRVRVRVVGDIAA
jgi:hypothetical protein